MRWFSRVIVDLVQQFLQLGVADHLCSRPRALEQLGATTDCLRSFKQEQEIGFPQPLGVDVVRKAHRVTGAP